MSSGYCLKSGCFFRTSVSVFRLLSKIRVFFRTRVSVFRLLFKIRVFFRTSVSVFRLLPKIRVFFSDKRASSGYCLRSGCFFRTSVSVFRLLSEIRVFFRHGRLSPTALKFYRSGASERSFRGCETISRNCIFMSGLWCLNVVPFFLSFCICLLFRELQEEEEEKQKQQ